MCIVFLLLVLLGFWKWQDWRASAQAGAAYAARSTCSCRFLEGRSAEGCALDLPKVAARARIKEQPDEKRIIATIPLLGQAAARFRPGYGCLMEP